MAGARHWLARLLVNAALATLMRAGAPTQPVNSDRVEYEYAGRNLLAPGCPHDV